MGCQRHVHSAGEVNTDFIMVGSSGPQAHLWVLFWPCWWNRSRVWKPTRCWF